MYIHKDTVPPNSPVPLTVSEEALYYTTQNLKLFLSLGFCNY